MKIDEQANDFKWTSQTEEPMSFSMEPQDFVINPDQDGGMAKKSRTSHFQLYDRETDEAVPLK